METLQSWALCITFSAVGALLVHALVPKGATEKAIRVMISLVFVIRNSIAVFIRKRDYAHVAGSGHRRSGGAGGSGAGKNKSYPCSAGAPEN